MYRLKIWRVQNFFSPSKYGEFRPFFPFRIWRRWILFFSKTSFVECIAKKYGELQTFVFLKIWRLWSSFSQKILCNLCTGFFLAVATVQNFAIKKEKKHQDWRRVTIDEKTSRPTKRQKKDEKEKLG
jgi:hypothetical protein